jgi:hypothetical protein
MTFSEEFLVSASREFESKYVAPDFERARDIIMQALEICAQYEPSIDPKYADIYIHGSYANKSNIYFPSNLEIIVELTTTKRFSPEDISLEDNYFVDVPLEFGPAEFRQLLSQTLVDMLGDKLTHQAKTLRVSGLENIKHDIEITPCFSFHFYKGDDGERNRGVLLHDAQIGRNIVTFPRLHAQNGFDKDQLTGGNFKRMVRLFKTLHLLNVNEFSFASSDTASGYFIECLLFNVPDNMFTDLTPKFKDESGEVQKQSLNEIFNKVINFLINANMDEFVCQNTIWRLFGKAAEFWDIQRAEQFTSAIIRLYSAFPPSRTFLA